MVYLINFTKFLFAKVYIAAACGVIGLGIGAVLTVKYPVSETWEGVYKFTVNADKSVAASYADISTSDEVYRAIAKEYSNKYPVKELKERIKFLSPANTRIVAITARDGRKEDAITIVKTAAKHTVPRLVTAFSLPESSVKPIAEPTVAPIAQGMGRRNTLFFGVTGLALGIVTTWFLYDLRVNGNNKKSDKR